MKTAAEYLEAAFEELAQQRRHHIEELAERSAVMTATIRAHAVGQDLNPSPIWDDRDSKEGTDDAEQATEANTDGP